MNNLEKIKKLIIYRSEYRGIKEMDLLLSKFVKKYINDLDINELKQLEVLLSLDDENLLKWYLNRKTVVKIPINKVTTLFKNFKLK